MQKVIYLTTIMMKSRLIFLFLFMAIYAQAQVGDTENKLNVMNGMATLNSSLKNLNGDSVHGDAALLQAIINYNHNQRHDSLLHLYFPANCRLKLDSTVYLPDNIIFEFSPAALVFSTSAMKGNVFESIAHSNIEFLNAHYTNHFASFINAFIQFKAAPRKCYNNKIIGCYVKNTWASAAYMLANATDTDSTFYLDNTLIKNDTAINIYNPAKPHMDFGDYGTNYQCNGINTLTANRKLTIVGFYCINMGGDGIFGYGLAKAMSHDSMNGHIEIKNCFIKWCNMNIEINGNYYNNGMYIHDNFLWWATTRGAYNISTGGKGLRVINNECHNADAGNLELEAESGTISYNKCYIVRWKDTAQGPQKAAYSSSSPRTWNVNLYGFNNIFTNNLCQVNPANPTSNSPAELNGILIAAKAPGNDTVYDRNCFQGFCDIPSFYYISNNTFIGQTHRVLDLTTTRVRGVNFVNNTIITANHLGTDDVCMIYGYHQIFKGNTFNMTGSAPPKNGHEIIKKRSQQTDSAGEIVQDNTIIGSAWYGNLYKYKKL